MGPAKAKSRGTVSRKTHYTVNVRHRDLDQKFGRDGTNETREAAAAVLVPSRSRQNGSFRKLQIDELPVSIDKSHRATDTWESFDTLCVFSPACSACRLSGFYRSTRNDYQRAQTPRVRGSSSRFALSTQAQTVSIVLHVRLYKLYERTAFRAARGAPCICFLLATLGDTVFYNIIYKYIYTNGQINIYIYVYVCTRANTLHNGVERY